MENILGDIDFVCFADEYALLNGKVLKHEIPNCSIYDRPGWDTIQISNPNYKVVSYLSTIDMAIKARVKFDALTNL